MASAAAIWRPSATPPAASTGVGATASMIWGHSTRLATSPVCPPPSVPWAITMSTPASLWRTAWCTFPHSAATARPVSFTLAMISGGGVPRALAMSATRSCESATSSWGSAVAWVQPSRRSPPSSSGSSGTPWSASSLAAKPRCSSGIMDRSCSSSLAGSSSPIPSYFAGMTRSIP